MVKNHLKLFKYSIIIILIHINYWITLKEIKYKYKILKFILVTKVIVLK